MTVRRLPSICIWVAGPRFISASRAFGVLQKYPLMPAPISGVLLGYREMWTWPKHNLGSDFYMPQLPNSIV